MAKTVKKAVRKKRRERKNIEKGQAHIQSTFNNTLVTLTDMEDPSKRTKITSQGIFISTDGGVKWKNAVRGDGIATQYLTSGTISTLAIIHRFNCSHKSEYFVILILFFEFHQLFDKGIITHSNFLTSYIFNYPTFINNLNVLDTSHFLVCLISHIFMHTTYIFGVY